MVVEVLEQCLIRGDVSGGHRAAGRVLVDDLLVVAQLSLHAVGTEDLRSTLELDEQDASADAGQGATHRTGDRRLAHPSLAEEESDRCFVP